MIIQGNSWITLYIYFVEYGQYKFNEKDYDLNVSLPETMVM